MHDFEQGFSVKDSNDPQVPTTGAVGREEQAAPAPHRVHVQLFLWHGRRNWRAVCQTPGCTQAREDGRPLERAPREVHRERGERAGRDDARRRGSREPRGRCALMALP